MTADVDVVVVGAGAAGLTCAKAVSAAGLSVVVFEARDRIGGRIHSIAVDGGRTVELGAQVVHGDRARVWEELGDPSQHVSYGVGTTFLARLGARVMPAWQLVRSGSCVLWGADALIVEAASRGVEPVAEVLRTAVRHTAVDEEWVRQVWAADPRELSSRGVAQVLGSAEAGQGEFIVTGGFAELARRLAAGLEVHLTSAVSAIDWSPGSAVVRLSTGRSVTTRACVVTVPPPVLTAGLCQIADLPGAVDDAIRTLSLGDALSVAVATAQPAPESAVVFDGNGEAGFWRAQQGSITATGVAKGVTARRLRKAVADLPEFRRLVGQLLPWADADSVELIAAADWGDDPYARGAFGHPTPERFAAAATLRSAIAGTIFFAGEATCGERHPASVHGAMESGDRAAADIVAALL